MNQNDFFFPSPAVQSLQQLSAPKISSHLRRSAWWSVCARVSSETPPTPRYPPGDAIFKQCLSCLLAARLQLLGATFLLRCDRSVCTRQRCFLCLLHGIASALFESEAVPSLFLSGHFALNVSLAELSVCSSLTDAVSLKLILLLWPPPPPPPPPHSPCLWLDSPLLLFSANLYLLFIVSPSLLSFGLLSWVLWQNG